MVTLYDLFKKPSESQLAEKTIKDVIVTMMILYPEILSNEPECLHTKIQILLNFYKDCKNFEEISKKSCNKNGFYNCITLERGFFSFLALIATATVR